MSLTICSVSLPDSRAIDGFAAGVQLRLACDDLLEFGNRLGVAGLGQLLDHRNFQGHPGVVDVLHRDALVLEDQAGVTGQRLAPRASHAGSATHSALDLDQGLGLEHPERFAQRRPRHPEALHQL
jgi:hypothetical protein